MTDILAKLQQMGGWTAPGEWTQDPWAAEAQREISRLRSDLDQARRMVERMATRINEVKETYEWCSEDPHDRGYSALDDAIRSAVASTERHCTFCHVPMGSSDCCESDFEAKDCPHMQPVPSPDGQGDAAC